jgi:hypothetical protein
MINLQGSDTDSVLVLLHHVDMGIVANVLEVHAASIFRIDPEQPKNKINPLTLTTVKA